MLNPRLSDRVEAALGARPSRITPLSGGCIAETVARLDMPDGRALVTKLGMAQSAAGPVGRAATLQDEAGMVRDLARLAPALPVPGVIHAEADFLVMTHLSGGSGFGAASEHLADLLADLHGRTNTNFGYERPTPVGPLLMRNRPHHNWPSFYAEERLMVFGRLALEDRKILPDCFDRLERLSARLDDWLPSDRKPGLIHGDLWGGNVLSDGAKITGMIDPAMFYADPELELGFMSVFDRPSPQFYDRYRERRGLDPEFEATRKPLYQLDGILAHAWFFGGGYAAQADAILRRYVG